MTRSTLIPTLALHPRRVHSGIAALGLVAAALVACGTDNGVGPAGPPASLTVTAGANQSGSVGAAVPEAPTVRVTDATGRGVAGVSVRFDVISGGGAVTGDSVVTDGDGLATVGEWRLGPLPVVNTLRAQTIDHPFQVSITATAAVGAPSSIQIVTGGANLAAVVGEEVFPKPTVRVRDAFGNPIPGASISWSIVSGGGSIIGPTTTTTDAEGRTTVGGWRLGVASGVNQLRAQTSNGIAATFTANAIGIPAAIVATSPAQQDGFINFAVPRTARAQVKDALGANIAGVPVVFKMTGGTGTILGDTVITDANGIAALGDWKLGASGFSQVTATVPGFEGGSLVFTANGVAKAFTIDVRFVTTPPPDLRDAYIAGALRWMQIIVGDLSDHTLTRPAGACLTGLQLPALNETVDDVIIYARIAPYDGPGNVLAQAGSCTLGERPGSFLTVLGGMNFDSDDSQVLLDRGQFVDVVTHEMGHVLGLEAFRFDKRGLIIGNNDKTDPRFIGAQATAAWPALGIAYSGQLVPLENAYTGGTDFHHWRESVLTSELMTGIIEAPGVTMPLTILSIAALADIGYVVDVTKAEPHFPNLLAPQARAGERLILREELFRGGVRIN